MHACEPSLTEKLVATCAYILPLVPGTIFSLYERGPNTVCLPSECSPFILLFFLITFFSDVHGQTPLHYASLQGSMRSIELILANKPECLNMTEKSQVTVATE